MTQERDYMVELLKAISVSLETVRSMPLVDRIKDSVL